MKPSLNRTPLVPAPNSTLPTGEAAGKSPLKAPIVIVAAGGEWEHESGELTIGRDAEANVTLADPLISRMHARLQVQANGQVAIEDLNSANGVFVNGAKVSRPSVQLCEGDRLLLGTTEVSVFSLRASARIPVRNRIDNPTEAPRPAVPIARQSLAEIAVKERLHARPTLSTKRVDAIELVGGLADQLAASGHHLEAVRVLSEHLQSLLRGASVGLTVPTHMLDRATELALRLLAWTSRTAWLDYAFELHVACQQLPSEASLQSLEAACGSAVEVDRTLISYLTKTIEGRSENLSIDETQRLRRLHRLAQNA